MPSLNQRQQEAVNTITGAVLVLAGAGSGKTSVITQKIAYLIQSCGLHAHQITALTFTNKAAREMKERVFHLLPKPSSRGLTVSTFHNLGLRIIRQEYKALGYRPGFSIFDAQDTLTLLKELCHREFEAAEDVCVPIQNLISQWKNNLINPQQALSTAEQPDEALAAKVYEAYEKTLKLYNGVDFDDLILQPVMLFKQQPDILQKWQNRVAYLLVDEYQDTNSSQYKLIKQLVGRLGNFTVVGDDDQSIYAWRGARPENLSILRDDFPHLKLIKLEQNYRSTSRILRVANQLIANNAHAFEKALWSNKATGEPIRLVHCTNDETEAERVAAEILQWHLQNQSRFKDFAILYRSNHQARLLEMKLQIYKVPYKISGGHSFFSKTEIKDVMAYLKLLLNPDNNNAFLRIINTPRRSIGTATVEKLVNHASACDTSLMMACQDPNLGAHLSGSALEKVQDFGFWLQNLADDAHQNEPIATVQKMLSDMQYEPWLLQTSTSPAMAEHRMNNVNTLIESLKTALASTADDHQDANMGDAVARLMLLDILERQEEEDDSNRVQLMTLHAAKGLEFPHVYILGMEENILPNHNSIAANDIEEERRLCYVGITRAQQTLTLTLARKRKQYGHVIETTPSRFLDELPTNDIETEGLGVQDAQAAKAKGKATLANLISMFDDD